MFDLDVINAFFFQKLAINIFSLIILIRFAITRSSSFNDSAFVYYMFGIGVFLVTYSMQRMEVSLGFAFGLFAIFSMLRYRTEVLSFKAMTCLFLVIVISLLCAVSPLSNFELIIISFIINAAVFVIESPLLASGLAEKTVRYEKITNIKPENYEVMLADLQYRTGLNIKRINVISIDFMQDSATLQVLYEKD